MPKAKTKTTTHYVVMEMGDEYNDEVYIVQDVGTPVQVYTDRAVADAECMRLQIKKLQGLEIGGYAYDCTEITGHDEEGKYGGLRRVDQLGEEEVKELLPFCKFKGDFNDWILPQNLTDEEAIQVCKVFSGLKFYTVVEV